MYEPQNSNTNNKIGVMSFNWIALNLCSGDFWRSDMPRERIKRIVINIYETYKMWKKWIWLEFAWWNTEEKGMLRVCQRSFPCSRYKSFHLKWSNKKVGKSHSEFNSGFNLLMYKIYNKISLSYLFNMDWKYC